MNLFQLVQENFSLIPVVILSIGGIVVLLLQSLIRFKENILLKFLVYFTIISSILSLVCIYTSYELNLNSIKFDIKINLINFWLNLIASIIVLIEVKLISFEMKRKNILTNEYDVILLFSLVGVFLILTSVDFLLIFIGLELFSICSYILIGMQREDGNSLEAALKYFLLGAFSAGFLLLGIAFLFGAGKTTNLQEFYVIIQTGVLDSSKEMTLYYNLGLILLLVGLFFKLALIPFHAWAPDVYEGSPSSVSLFLITIPKVATLGLLMFVMNVFYFNNFIDKNYQLEKVLSIICMITMTFANIFALRQDSFKRLLAFSSISQTGILLSGVIFQFELEVVYYLIIYVLNSILIFVAILLLETKLEKLNLKNIQGLVTKNALLAIMILFSVLSFAGVPPFSGFWSKLFLFQKLAKVESALGNLIFISVIINSAIALYYYIKIIIPIFYKTEDHLEKIELSIFQKFSGILLIVICLFFWIFFQPESLVRLF